MGARSARPDALGIDLKDAKREPRNPEKTPPQSKVSLSARSSHLRADSFPVIADAEAKVPGITKFDFEQPSSPVRAGIPDRFVTDSKDFIADNGMRLGHCTRYGQPNLPVTPRDPVLRHMLKGAFCKSRNLRGSAATALTKWTPNRRSRAAAIYRDIPILVPRFTQPYARRMNRGIDEIPKATMDALLRYSWPGR